MPSGVTCLTEINLRGGLRGAKIDAGSYREKIKTVEGQRLATEYDFLQSDTAPTKEKGDT